MVASPARGHLNREIDFFPNPVFSRECGRVRQVWPSRTASAQSFSTPRLNLLNSVYFGVPLLPLVFRDDAVNGHLISPELIGSHNCVPMAFTAKSPPAQGQCSPQGSSSNGWCLFRKPDGPIFVRHSFLTHTIGTVFVFLFCMVLRSRVSRPMAMTGHVDATWGGSFWRV